jgi:hypothetical protein
MHQHAVGDAIQSRSFVVMQNLEKEQQFRLVHRVERGRWEICETVNGSPRLPVVLCAYPIIL